MPLPPLSTAFAILRPSARRFLRLYAERRAGRLPLNQAPDFMDGTLNDTLRRLCGGRIDAAWWDRILHQFGQRYVAPDFLQKPALQEWLADPQVSADFKTLAQNRIMTGSPDPEEPTIRLTESYSRFTGEASHFARGSIEVVIAVLVAGYIASIPHDQRAVAGMIQHGFRDMDSRFDQLEEGFRHNEADPITQRVHTREARAELSTILHVRAIDNTRTRANVQTLLARTRDGDLVAADAQIKAKIAYWAARLCATEPSTLPAARELRSELTLTTPELDLAVLDSLIALTDGNGDEALRIVRDLHHADARTVVFRVLATTKSDQAAIAWADREKVRDDDGFFTDVGWVNWAICSARIDRWERTAERLSKLDRLWGDCPALAFIEGRMNAAMLLPSEFRHVASDSVPLYPGVRTAQGSIASKFHARAVLCFEFFREAIVGLDGDLANQVDDWLQWLRIVDTDITKANLARAEISDRMNDGREAVALILFATVFEIPYDPAPLREHLDRRMSLGGFDQDEDLAQLLLVQRSIAPRDLIAHIENHRERLSMVVHPSFLFEIEIEALARDKQIHRARALIAGRTAELGEEHAARLSIFLDAHEGTDPRAKLERLYESTRSVVDLRNLVYHLKEVKDTVALRPLLFELFEIERSVENALDVVRCLGGPPHFDYMGVTGFIDSNPDLVSDSDDLYAGYGRALYLAGRIQKAKQVNDELLDRREDLSDSLLDGNIAIASGDWDRVAVVVDREWTRRDSHDGATLMHLACLASQVSKSPDRALEFARLATVRAPDDARVLAAAFWLYFKLDRERQVDHRWLKRAADLSSPDEGPLWRVDLQDAIERLFPRRRDVVRDVERKWLGGDIPISVAASTFNVSLARMLGHIPRNNYSSLDGRKRVPLPIISGERSCVEIQQEWTIGLDVTSVLVLEHIGLLRHAVRAFHHIKLAPDVMQLLFQERDEARFHQPSLVTAAKELQTLQNAGRITLTDGTDDPPKELVEETGVEIATLLHVAEQGNGRVVCVLPLRKPGSLTEFARLGTWDRLVVSTVDICTILYEEGRIDSDDYQRAIRILEARGQGKRGKQDRSIGDGPLYIDEVALSYLRDANVLRAVTDSISNVEIHTEVAKRAHALIEESDHADEIAAWIERIRITLRDAINDGAVSLLPQTSNDSELSQPGGLGWRSAMSLFLSRASCDAICIDDRCLNRHTYIDDDTGNRVPIVCVIDILRHLVSLGTIRAKDHWIARHKMRRSGLSYIQIDPEELSHWLLPARVEAGSIIESAELRVLRQSAAGVAVSGLLTENEVTTLTANQVIACKATIERVWEDPSVPVERTTALSDWAWRNLVMGAIYQADQSAEARPRDPVSDTIVSRLAVILLPIPIEEKERRRMFAGWLEHSVLSPLRPANAAVIDQALEFVCDAIVSAPTDQDVYGNLFLDQLPSSARSVAISKRPELAEGFGFTLVKMFRISNAIEVSSTDLIQAVRQVFDSRAEVNIQDTSGRNLTVDLHQESEEIVVRCDHGSEEHEEIALAAMNVLSPFKTTRCEAIQEIVDRIGATGSDFLYRSTDIADRALTDDEVGWLLSDLVNGVAARWFRLCWLFRRRAPVSICDIVPTDVSYYEKLCGPSPSGQKPESYLQEILIPYRLKLLKRDLGAGLEICLLGALRDDLCPGKWLTEADDDAIWEGLAKHRGSNNPFVLIAGIDVAAYRQTDSRFRQFSEDAIASLSRATFGDGAGRGFQSLSASLSDFVLNRINLLEGCAVRPGYWKRMCAWMQAGRIVDALAGSAASIETNPLHDWVADNMVSAGLWADFVDLREEPWWQQGRATLDVWKDEIVGRVCILKSRHEDAGREFPGWDRVTKELSGRIGEWERGVLSIPGPLEGHRRPLDRVPERVARELELAWEENPDYALRGLANLCLRFGVAETVLERTRATVSKLSYDVSGRIFQRLEYSSMVAARTRDVTLARIVGDAAVRMAPRFSSRAHVVKILCIILTAAAAYEEREPWVKWLGDILTRVAGRLPEAPGECLHALREFLDTFNIVLPIDSWFQVRARSVASSGC